MRSGSETGDGAPRGYREDGWWWSLTWWWIPYWMVARTVPGRDGSTRGAGR